MISEMDNHFRLFVYDVIGGGNKMVCWDAWFYLGIRDYEVSQPALRFFLVFFLSVSMNLNPVPLWTGFFCDR